MGHQLTTVLAAARRLVQRVVPPADEVSPSWPPGDLREALGSAHLERWRADEPVRSAQVVASLADDPQGLTVLRRALAADVGPDDASELLATWRDRPRPTRAAVLDPVRSMGTAARQGDATTCGSAVLTLLAAVGDPWLALWLADGTSCAGRRPTELSGATGHQLASLADGPPERRFVAVQQVVRRRTSARGLLVAPWPPSLGTPPWGAAAQARHPGVRYGSVVLDDTRTEELTGALDRVALAVDRGVPVPLYVGGDSAQGWSRAVPRHVVLAVGTTGDGLVLWEPASGRRFSVPRGDLLAPTGPRAALGGWTHLAWAVLPTLRPAR
ncbi:hypothetical protein [Actinotalea sp. K2]|uniref:hypothetical protein n=1 Tax=Actinotalea sp. K2 TaxID=2939438 RepID=UPI0020176D42|nr:hypothetical protein [Actinotalea sp. K2]MCL3862624.1 hypothetical protein [Actinotalea sp. K2]